MAIWMEENPVVCFISAALTSPDDMVAVPPCQFGDFPLAKWAKAVLLFPEGKYLPFPFKVLCHFHIETLFKVGLPIRVIRVGFILDFTMSLDSDTFGLEQSNRLSRSILSKNFSLEYPVLPTDGLEVFLLHPFDGLLWVSPFCPLPERTEDRMVYLREGFRAYHVAVIVCPSPNFRVELSDQVSGGGLLVVSNDFSNAFKKGMDVLSRGSDKQLSLVFAEMLSEKIETILNMCDEGLFW